MNKRPIDPKTRKQDPHRPTIKKEVEFDRSRPYREPKAPVPDRGVAPGITG